MAKTLLEVLSEQNIELKKSGDRYKAYCPFHKDDTPSFTIYPTNTYYCFGCHVWGDAVKFLVEYKGISSQDALEYVGIDYKQPRAEKNNVIKLQDAVAQWVFLKATTTLYHNYLMRIPGPVNYLQRRGLTLETIQKYQLGYTDGHVLNLQFAYTRKLADEVGLMTKSGYETLSHRIVVPNLIDQGVDFLMGRTVINDKVKYLGLRMPKPLMGFHEVRKSPVILIVEGQFDWLTLRQWNLPAICMSGSQIKHYQLLPLKEKQLIVVPDYDDSGEGRKAAERLKKTLPHQVSILDYSALRDGSSKLDVSVLAERNNGQTYFENILGEHIWNTPILRETLGTSLGDLMKVRL